MNFLSLDVCASGFGVILQGFARSCSRKFCCWRGRRAIFQFYSICSIPPFTPFSLSTFEMHLLPQEGGERERGNIIISISKFCQADREREESLTSISPQKRVGKFGWEEESFSNPLLSLSYSSTPSSNLLWVFFFFLVFLARSPYFRPANSVQSVSEKKSYTLFHVCT